MNPFETLAIKLLFTIQKAPPDFTSGLIEALNEDLANKEHDAQQNVNILMEQVAQLREPAELVPTVAILAELSDLWKSNEQIQQQAGIVRQIADITMLDPKAPFGSRIALERIAGLANRIKSISGR
jgi:hypothetical protein